MITQGNQDVEKITRMRTKGNKPEYWNGNEQNCVLQWTIYEMAVLTLNCVLHPILPWLLAMKKKNVSFKAAFGGHLMACHLYTAKGFTHIVWQRVFSNHRWPLSAKFQKPLKNHWSQWSDGEKTFSGDGSRLAKQLMSMVNALEKWPSVQSEHMSQMLK